MKIDKNKLKIDLKIDKNKLKIDLKKKNYEDLGKLLLE